MKTTEEIIAMIMIILVIDVLIAKLIRKLRDWHCDDEDEY